jgi:hypothetical protein
VLCREVARSCVRLACRSHVPPLSAGGAQSARVQNPERVGVGVCVCVCCSVRADRALPKNNLDDVLRKVSSRASEFIYSVPQHHPNAFENLLTPAERYDPTLCPGAWANRASTPRDHLGEVSRRAATWKPGTWEAATSCGQRHSSLVSPWEDCPLHHILSLSLAPEPTGARDLTLFRCRAQTFTTDSPSAQQLQQARTMLQLLSTFSPPVVGVRVPGQPLSPAGVTSPPLTHRLPTCVLRSR